ncbi:MAG: glycosyltransferase 87 family protein [Methanomassiliicoccaceae archaeon]|nr:glycosyltransferase 87 family protein [Methanomassiliicoccaceae archaeon]
MRAEEIPKKIITFLKIPVVIILIIGLAIRFVIMPTLSLNYDVSYWALVIQHIQAGAGLYEITGYWYTPVWGYILSIMSLFMNMTGLTDYGHLFDEIRFIEGFEGFYTATLTTPAFNFFVKIPAVIADVLVGYMIYKLVLEMTGDKKKATYGFALWFLCPLVIYTSSVHGMFDSIYVMFMVLSVYALRKGHDFLAGASLAVAILLKVFPAFIMFALIAYLIKKHRDDIKVLRKRILTAVLGAGLMTLIIYIPQILDGTVMESLLFLTSRIDASSLSIHSANTWDALVLFGRGIIILLQPILAILAIALIYKIFKKSEDLDKALFTSLMVTTAVILMWPASPQFVLTALPFLICFAAIYDKRFVIPFLVITIGAVCTALNNPSVLLSLAAYTDILSIETVISMMEWFQQPLFGLSRHFIVMAIAMIVQMIGFVLLLLYWIRHEKEVKSHA